MRTSSICDEPIHLSLGFQIYDNNIFCKKMCVTRYINSRSIRSRALFYLLRIYQFYLPGLVHVVTDCWCNYRTQLTYTRHFWILGNQNVIFVVFYTEIFLFLLSSFNIFAAYAQNRDIFLKHIYGCKLDIITLGEKELRNN